MCVVCNNWKMDIIVFVLEPKVCVISIHFLGLQNPMCYCFMVAGKTVRDEVKLIMGPYDREHLPKPSRSLTKWQSAKRKSSKSMKGQCVPAVRRITFKKSSLLFGTWGRRPKIIHSEGQCCGTERSAARD